MNWGAIILERDVAGIVDVVVRDELYGVWDAFVMFSLISLVVSTEEDKIGDLLTEVGGGREDGGEVQWVLEVEERRRDRGIVRKE